MKFGFEDAEELANISRFVSLIKGLLSDTSVSCIKKLDTKLKHADKEPYDGYYATLCTSELICLHNICYILSRIGADEINSGTDMYIRTKKLVKEASK